MTGHRRSDDPPDFDPSLIRNGDSFRTLLVTLVLGAYLFTAAFGVWLYAIIEPRIARIESQHVDGFKRLEQIEIELKTLKPRR